MTFHIHNNDCYCGQLRYQFRNFVPVKTVVVVNHFAALSGIGLVAVEYAGNQKFRHSRKRTNH